MPLASRLGPYQVLSSIGSGGMGEVYRARDTKLNRDVALKVLPEAFALDPDRLARFRREAQVLASLNHPHIGAIYGFEESDRVHALVLELVDGPTLADRIHHGPIPLDEALPIARQIADALEAAHEQGVVHRDLKPANIKLRSDGTVKVLDFGLAKMLDVAGSGAGRPGGSSGVDLTTSPTLTSPAMTRAGVILGTAAYMSPEQTRGANVDARADIWAFGCVLYEMLAGLRAFPGDTTSDAIAAILEREPRWDRLPDATPESVRRLLRRCLTKDARQRLRHVADARIEIDEASAARTSAATTIESSTRPRRSAWLTNAAVAVVVAAAAGALAWTLRGTPSATSRREAISRVVVNTTEPLPGDVGSLVAVSPDGRQLAYVAGRDRQRQLFLRRLDQFESRPVPGTEGADFPVFSPDGQWLAFVADQKIKKVAVTGGTPLVLCDVTRPRGVSWGSDDTIFFNPGTGSGIQRVSAAGGTPVAVTKLASGELDHMYPDVLPDRSAVLFNDTGSIYAQSLKTGERHRLGLGASPHYLPTGHLTYVADGVLYAMPFDSSRLEATGQPVAMVEGVGQTLSGAPQISFSRAGTMAYVASNGQPRQDTLVWVEQDGTEQLAGVAGGLAHAPRLSPNGRRISVISGPNRAGDVLLYDVSRETWNRFTSDRNMAFAAWTPDGKGLTVGSLNDGRYNIYTSSFDGSAQEPLLKDAPTTNPMAWSPDGNHLAVVTVSSTTSQDIGLIDRRNPGTPKAFLNSKFREGAPTFSPDGRWIAYVSDKSGRTEVYMRPVEGGGEEWTISTDGGNEPLWARHASLLFYRHDDAVMVVDVVTAPTVSAGKPRMLFERRYQRSEAFWPNYDVTSDGKRLLMIKRAEDSLPAHINVVLNWFEELKQRVPAK
jgi:eukaryotic-like serine/threonine-protein kinase